jgi:hypothetical protein
MMDDTPGISHRRCTLSQGPRSAMLKTLDPATLAAEPVTRNRLLARLAPDDLAKISPYLELVELKIGLILQEANARIQHVYFPTTGSVSMMILASESGRSGLRWE